MNIGDLVRLKSGGPVMTVTQVEPSFLGCTWMPTDGSPKQGYACFPEAALEAAELQAVFEHPIAAMQARTIETLKEEVKALRDGRRDLEAQWRDAKMEAEASRDMRQDLGAQYDQARAELVNAKSRASVLSDQVNAAGSLGVKWSWEGGTCKATIDDDGLRVQLAVLADFHNKVAALLR